MLCSPLLFSVECQLIHYSYFELWHKLANQTCFIHIGFTVAFAAPPPAPTAAVILNMHVHITYNQRQRGRTSNVPADASHGTKTGNDFIFSCSNFFSSQFYWKNWKAEKSKRKKNTKTKTKYRKTWSLYTLYIILYKHSLMFILLLRFFLFLHTKKNLSYTGLLQFVIFVSFFYFILIFVFCFVFIFILFWFSFNFFSHFFYSLSLSFSILSHLYVDFHVIIISIHCLFITRANAN